MTLLKNRCGNGTWFIGDPDDRVHNCKTRNNAPPRPRHGHGKLKSWLKECSRNSIFQKLLLELELELEFNLNWDLESGIWDCPDQDRPPLSSTKLRGNAECEKPLANTQTTLSRNC